MLLHELQRFERRKAQCLAVAPRWLVELQHRRVDLIADISHAKLGNFLSDVILRWEIDNCSIATQPHVGHRVQVLKRMAQSWLDNERVPVAIAMLREMREPLGGKTLSGETNNVVWQTFAK